MSLSKLQSNKRKMAKLASIAIIFFALSADGGQYGLNGTITSFYFNAPVESCFVKLQPESPTALGDSMYTDRLGHYSFPNIWPGVYTVCVTQRNYLNDSLYTVVDSMTTENFELMKKTNVYYSDLPDTLKKASSPYIIGDSMDIEHSLFIEPGTEIAILQYLNIHGPQLIALGTKSDSIVFTSNSGDIDLNLNSNVQHYRHCTFFNINNLSLTQQDSIKPQVSFDTCHFSDLPSLNIDVGLVEMCCSIILGSSLSANADKIELLQNNWTDAENYSNINLEYSHAVIKNNNFLKDFQIESNGIHDTIINNIFSQGVWLSGTSLFFAYNDVINLQETVVGIGNPVIHNDNGYPCDLFFNIYTDPLISDTLTGALQSGSPCIRAGLNGNIGFWQGQGGIYTGVIKRSTLTGRQLTSKPETMSILQSERAFGGESRLFDGKQGPVSLYSLNGRRLTVINNNVQFNSTVKRLSPGIFVIK